MNIKINSLTARTEDLEIISTINFSVVVENSMEIAEQQHEIQLNDIEKSDPMFVQFSSLTKEKIIDWIVATVGQAYLETMEKNALLKLDVPVKQVNLPWQQPSNE